MTYKKPFFQKPFAIIMMVLLALLAGHKSLQAVQATMQGPTEMNQMNNDSRLLAADVPFSAKLMVDNVDGGRFAKAGDMDNDGDLDVVAAVYNSNSIVWWANNGSATAWTKQMVDQDFENAWDIHLADIDDDGDLDILGVSNGPDGIVWWQNSDGDFTRHAVDAALSFPTSAVTSDFDSDGDLDVVATVPGINTILWWANNDGSGTDWTEHTVDANVSGARAVAVADINSDGKLDIVGTSRDNNEISWWANEGEGITWTRQLVADNFAAPLSVQLADIDGDGNIDILSAAIDGAEVSWWANTNGNGETWQKHVIDNTFGGPYSVASADLDGDSDLDVLSASINQDQVAWWENLDGTGGSWTQHSLSLYEATSGIATDIDSDGDLDILGAGSTEIAWWENNPTIIYVDADATGGNNGSSWTNAYPDLQDGLAAATVGDEIWVAEGIYKPTDGISRTISFELKNGVGIYGGFNGSQSTREERDPEANMTTLSGDLNGDDNDNVAYDEPTRSENSYHVVNGSNTDSSAVLDGFTITGGNANEDFEGGLCTNFCGGGMYNRSGSPTVQNMIFSANSARTGGGMYNLMNSSPNVSHVTFSGNSGGEKGGGMRNSLNSNPIINDVIFENNSAEFGGGISNWSDSSPLISNTTFTGNSAAHGGGMFNETNSSPSISDATFTGNSATYHGGGMSNWSGSSPLISNTTFSNNHASDDGGGMLNYNSNPTLYNVTFTGNYANGAGIHVSDDGGGMYNDNSSPILVNVLFSGNSANGTGGGMSNWLDSHPILNHVTFSGNSALTNGGGLYHYESDSTTSNSIFWNNQDNDGDGVAPTSQIYTQGNSTATVTNSLVQGGFAGTGNIDANPRFVSPIDPYYAPTTDGDYRLLFTSPAIDAGDNSLVPADTLDLDGDGDTSEPLPYDLDGNQRIDSDTVDMGAYEYIPTSPKISVSPASFSLMVGEGQVVREKLTIGNAGTSNLDWSASSDAVWLSVDPTSDTVLNGNPRSVWVNIDTTGLISGTYTATLTLNTNDPEQPTTEVPFEVTVTPNLLVIYALAFDNAPLATHNLAPYYQETMEAIVEGTKGALNKTAIVLVDLEGEGNTQIRVIHNGTETLIEGLPDTNGTLSSALDEYDMADGATLGGFLKWALDNHTTAVGKTIFSYVGHGSAVVAETDIDNIFPEAQGLRGPTIPLPWHYDAYPAFTDYQARSILSPYDLAHALDIATNGGQDRQIALLDLVHCFAATIEEFYELSNPDGGRPYATTITGSPSYAYMNPRMLGAALAASDPDDSPQELATKLIETYDTILASDDYNPSQHPRLLVAVESSQILVDIHTYWNNTSNLLLNAFENNYQETFDNIRNAYLASAKYDTTFCQPQDWELAEPDALVDMVDFADQLSDEFGLFSPVGRMAQLTKQALQNTIISTRFANGQPWFANVEPRPTWNFEGNLGLGLYADFLGQTLDNDPGTTYLNWQARWYTDTLSIENPQPYAFVRHTSWDEVFQKFWENENVETVACLPALPPARRPGEVSARTISLPLEGFVAQNAAVWPAVIIEAESPEFPLKPRVQFTISQNDSLVYSNTVSAGVIVTGSYEIHALESWQPEISGPFTLTVTVDADDRISETNESDNIITMIDQVWPSIPEPLPIITATLSNSTQWISDQAIRLNIIQAPETSQAPVGALAIQYYQYQAGDNPNTRVPVKIHEEGFRDIELPLTDFALTLPDQIKPGPVVLHLWAYSVGGTNERPVVIRFNYAPNNQTVVQGQNNYLVFHAEQGESIQLDLTVADEQDANLFVWDPHSYGTPLWRETKPGNDNLSFIAPVSGKYVIGIHGETTANYTLSVNVGYTPLDRVTMLNHDDDNPNAYIPDTRPSIFSPIPQSPNSVTLALEPPSNISVGQTFEVPIIIDAGTQFVDAGSAYLNFDPAFVEVITITAGSALPLVLQNQFDNSIGQLDIAQGALENYPSGSFILATVTFRAIAETNGTAITFNSSTPRLSDVTFEGDSVLLERIDSTIVIQNASLTCAITLEGRPTPPHASWSVRLDVRLIEEGQSEPTYSFTPTTDQYGSFTTFGIAAGTYQLWIKHSHTLATMQTVTLTEGSNSLDCGTLREGDANNDNFVTIHDFSILAGTFGKCEGMAGYDERADFNQSGCITIHDFSLLAHNFGESGDSITQMALPQRQAVMNGVTMLISPPLTTIRQGEYFTVTLQLQSDNQPVDGVQVGLRFDPTVLKIQQVITGTALPMELLNQVDNTNGTIDIALGALSNFPSGSIDVAQIRLQALAPSEGTSLTFDSQNDVTFAAASILSEQHEGSIIIEEGAATAVTMRQMEATTNPQRSIALLLGVIGLVIAMMIVRKQR